MLGLPFDSGVTGIRARHVFLTVQQFVDLGEVRDIGGGHYHVMHQAQSIAGTDVRFRAEVILVALLDLVHFRVMLAALALGRALGVDELLL